MQIIDNKALLYKLRNPAPVLAAIPDSKLIDANTVAVRWDLPQVHTLRARTAFDKKNGKAARAGKDIGHKKPLARGGSNSDGVRLESRSSNRAKGGALSKPPKKK